jgi:hypothetical protein
LFSGLDFLLLVELVCSCSTFFKWPNQQWTHNKTTSAHLGAWPSKIGGQIGLALSLGTRVAATFSTRLLFVKNCRLVVFIGHNAGPISVWCGDDFFPAPERDEISLRSVPRETKCSFAAAAMLLRGMMGRNATVSERQYDTDNKARACMSVCATTRQ